MRAVLSRLAYLVVPSMVFAACSQDLGSTATGTSGTGGAPDCTNISIGDDETKPCNSCLHKECCAETAACVTADCIQCINFYDAGCSPESRAVKDCLFRCYPSCSPHWPPTTTGSGTGGTGSSTSGG